MIKKLLLLFVLIAALFIISWSQEVDAGAGQNVSGWAWSENIGWISFNSANCDPDGNGLTGTSTYVQCPVNQPITNYGVNIDTNHKFSGYAWSENVGWITFNESDLQGCPSTPCRADINSGNGEVSGWARVLAASSTDPGGWDGWIKLRGVSKDGSSYGVSWNPITEELEGWAWSDMVAGWISFNCLDRGVCGTSNYKVAAMFDAFPAATNLSVTSHNSADYCGMAAYPPVRLNWQFSDFGDSQSAYQIEIDDTSNFSSLVSTTTKIMSGSQSAVVMTPTFSKALSWNTLYYWRLRVWDQASNTSSWIVYQDNVGSSESFTTASHAYPRVDFAPSPLNAGAGEVVTFKDNSTCYLTGGGTSPCKNLPNPPGLSYSSFLWDFGNNSTSSFKGNATTTYNMGQYSSALTITDDMGTCSAASTNNIRVTNPLDWKEIIPF